MTENPSTEVAAPPLLQAEQFEPLLGRDVRFGDTDFTLSFVHLERLSGRQPAGLARAPFILIFSGARSATYLAEGLYVCDFGDGATFDIHVAPINTLAADRQDYQAIFN